MKLGAIPAKREDGGKQQDVGFNAAWIGMVLHQGC